MPQYGDVLYNLTGLYVAKFNGNNSWGTPSFVEYGQRVSFEFEMSNDEIMAYGLVVETLSIANAATITMGQAALDFPTAAILSGLVSSESGSTPTSNATMDYLVGGAGLPYFGMVGAFAATNGANVLIGFPKMMLMGYQPFEMDQNTFRVAEFEGKAIAPSTIVRKVCRVRKFETAGTLPSTAQQFAEFFNGMF